MKKVAHKSKYKIALIEGGPGPERDISLISAGRVAQAFDELGYDYFRVTADRELCQTLLTHKAQLAFLALHGLYGEDGTVQALCEWLKIPYTGSGILASALCMDKIASKKLLEKYKIPIPDFEVITEGKAISNQTYPVVVKSSHGGSSLGTEIVKQKSQLLAGIKKAQELGTAVFLEEYIPSAKEIAVSFLDGHILTPIEIEPKGRFYDYKRKYTKGETRYYLPPRLDPFVIEKTKALARKVFKILNVRSYARADFLVDKNNTAWLLEVNTLPGLTPQSLLPQSAKKEGISFTELIKRITDKAQTDYKPSG